MAGSPPPVLRVPRYPAISPAAFQHSADRAATAAPGSIPVIHQVVKRLSEMRFDRIRSGSYVRRGQEAPPDRGYPGATGPSGGTSR